VAKNGRRLEDDFPYQHQSAASREIATESPAAARDCWNFYFPISVFTLAFSCTAGEPRWLRVQFRDGGIARPLEPDAGNAAEGSEGPMPDWRFQPSLPRLGFSSDRINKTNKMILEIVNEKDSVDPFRLVDKPQSRFAMPSKVEGSLKRSVCL
jgi:hypothetical protein